MNVAGLFHVWNFHHLPPSSEIIRRVGHLDVRSAILNHHFCSFIHVHHGSSVDVSCFRIHSTCHTIRHQEAFSRVTACLQLLQAFGFLIRQATSSCNESIGLDDARNLHSHRERLRAASGSCNYKQSPRCSSDLSRLQCVASQPCHSGTLHRQNWKIPLQSQLH